MHTLVCFPFFNGFVNAVLFILCFLLVIGTAYFLTPFVTLITGSRVSATVSGLSNLGSKLGGGIPVYPGCIAKLFSTRTKYGKGGFPCCYLVEACCTEIKEHVNPAIGV